MAVHRAWVIKCYGCDTAATFYSPDYSMRETEAKQLAHSNGWAPNYGGDWLCKECWEKRLAETTPASGTKRKVRRGR